MIKIVKDIKDANCITHSGTMHADEVFATAFLELYLENIKLIRVSNVPKDIAKDVLVYDIGRGKFDHHQDDVDTRDNGIKYSSIGLLWKEYGKDYLKKNNIDNIDDVFKSIDKDLIEGIDAIDNGIFPEIEANYKVKTLSDVIKLFNPSSFTDEDEATQFLKAEKFAKEIFIETMYNAIGKIKSKEIVNEIINKTDGPILELEEYLPYEEAILTNDKGNDLLFVTYPSNRGGYAIKTIPKSIEDKTDRLLLPKSWAGLANEELEKVTGIEGVMFCHTNRFIATAKTKESIKALAKKALE